MTIDKATIINQALTDIGAGPMFSIDDGTDQAEAIASVWPVVVDRVFGLADWSFARKTYKLSRLAETPNNGWRYAFELPTNRIGNPLKIMDRAGSSPRPLRDFSIEEGKLFCDCDTAWALVKVAVDPDYWPGEFRSAFVLALGAYLALPIWQDENLQDKKLQEAFGTPSQGGTGGWFGRLIAQDKASQPLAEPIADDEPVTNARFSSGGRDAWYGRY